MSLFAELKRRNVIRVGLAYLVFGWLALQVADLLVDLLELPAALGKIVFALVAMGFFPALVFAWVYEMTPEGLKRESRVPRGESITPQTGRKLDVVITGLLVIAIGLFALDRFAMHRQAGPIAPPSAATMAPSSGVPVVAVLPLKTLSTDQEGNFLAAGLHDDLLTRLAKLQAFRVISRTSVMEYADTTKNMRQIGEELRAGYIVEGGLQSIGGRVSINAQLIEAATDQHLWAETFTRPLTTANLFEVQAEIAEAISTALRATLSPEERKQLATAPTQNLDAYRAYLRGLEYLYDLSAPGMRYSEEAFLEAVTLDPQFSDAWSNYAMEKASRYWEEGGETGTGPDPALREAAKQALARAQAINPEGVMTLIAEAYYHYYGFRDYSTALIALGRAEAVAPYDPMVIGLRGFLYRRLGRFDEAADTLLRLIEADPNNRGALREAITTLRAADRCEESLTLARNAVARYPDYTGILQTAAWSELYCANDSDAGRRFMERATVTTGFEMQSLVGYLIAVRDLEAATGQIQVLKPRLDEDPYEHLRSANLLTWLYREMGQQGLSKEAAVEAAAAAAELSPSGAGVLAGLAMMEALRGNRDAALAYVDSMFAAAPQDAFTEDAIRFNALLVCALAGATDQALKHMEGLLQLPNRAGLARPETLSSPYFDDLRQDPRFQQVLDRTAAR